MKYWQEYLTKFGFSDGEMIPPDAEEQRSVAVAVVNAFAEKFGSSVRAIKYDRGGCHNPYIVLFVPAGLADTTKIHTYEGHFIPDEAMAKAIEYAHEEDIDSLINVKVSVNYSKFNKMMKSIRIIQMEEKQ